MHGHCVRKDAGHLIFDEDIAKLLLSDRTRRESDVLKALNNFNSEKRSYDTSQLPKFAFGPEPGRLVDLSLRHKVLMKASIFSCCLCINYHDVSGPACLSIWKVFS
jgi:hypothetical protein